MLRLSKLTDYGTVAMAHIAREPDRIHAAAELAAVIGVAVPTVSKILKMLSGGNLLQSVRGPKGGYRLSRPAGEISVAQVIDAMEGPIGVTECSAIAGLCAQEGSCTVRANWQRINRVIHDALVQMTLADLARPNFKPSIKPVHLDARVARRQRAPASGSPI
jgi:FeS assembly SUF system regulator